MRSIHARLLKSAQIITAPVREDTLKEAAIAADGISVASTTIIDVTT